MSATGGSEAQLRAALREQHEANAALTIENTRLRAALAEAEARAHLAPAADDYPSAVFRELWRVLKELRAATGAEGRALRSGFSPSLMQCVAPEVCKQTEYCVYDCGYVAAEEGRA